MAKRLRDLSAFCIIPYSVMYDQDLSDGEVRIYIAISSLANQRGYCFASNNYLANALGKSSSTIKRALQKLEQKGFIKRDTNRLADNKTNRKIYLSFDKIFDKPTDEVDQKCTGVGSKMSQGWVKNELGGRVKNEPQNNISNNNIRDNNIRDIESGKSQKYNYDLIVSKYNSIAKECKLTSIYKLSDKRRIKLKARLDEVGEDELLKAIDKIKESSFLIGNNDRNWKISFDWLINNDNNMIKLLEDKYKDDKAADDFAIFDQIGTHIWWTTMKY